MILHKSKSILFIYEFPLVLISPLNFKILYKINIILFIVIFLFINLETCNHWRKITNKITWSILKSNSKLFKTMIEIIRALLFDYIPQRIKWPITINVPIIITI